MRKSLISICIIGILICSICGCAQTAAHTPVPETENIETEYTETEGEEAAITEDTENDVSVDDKEIAMVCEKVREIDFTANQSQIDIPTEENKCIIKIYGSPASNMKSCLKIKAVENNGLPLKTLEEVFGELLEERKVLSEENYIDEEAFLTLKEIYGQIDFNGVFYQGNQSKADLYKAQFNRFLKGEIPILEKETGEEVYIYDYQIFKEDVELDIFDLNRYTYYYFDMDGDDNPELCIKDDVSSVFVIKYDEGEWEYGVWFKTEYNKDGIWYMVSLPRYYTQSDKSFELDDKIRRQGFYDNSQHLYYFLVTEEQYNELTHAYVEAYQLAEEKRQEVTYSYEELFGSPKSKTEEQNWR